MCFSICRFSQVVLIPRGQPRAQSLFLFPIVFGINNNINCAKRSCTLPHFSSNIPDAISSHPDPVIARTKWLFHLQDGEKKLDAFLLENWTHVFAEKEEINEIWKRWKAQFFQDIKSFIGHEIKSQQSEPPTLKSPWFSNDIRRLVRAKKTVCSVEPFHRGRRITGGFTVRLVTKQQRP